LGLIVISKTSQTQQRRPQEPWAASKELQDTLTDEELSMPLGEIIADKAQKSRQSKSKTKPSGGTGRQKRTAQAAMLEDEPTPKASGPPTYKGGSAGRRAFTVAELVLLNQCVDEIGFEGGDLWMKVAEKFNQERHAEWPERNINSLKKKFMEVNFYDCRVYGQLIKILDRQFEAQDR
jgi:hypothetical protein